MASDSSVNINGYPVVSIASVKGGCGRSLIAGYLALALCRKFPNTSIYLVDLDFGTSGQMVLFDMSEDLVKKFQYKYNAKRGFADAIRDEDALFDLLSTAAPNLRHEAGIDKKLFSGLQDHEGILRLLSGPGIATKGISGFARIFDTVDSNIPERIRAVAREVCEGPAILILDLEAGINGETPQSFQDSDMRVLVVRPDRQHRHILADHAVQDALLLDRGGEQWENSKLMFNFVPDDVNIDDLLKDDDVQVHKALQKYKNILVRSCGSFDSSLLRDERFQWPIPSAFQAAITELADQFYQPVDLP